MAQKVSQFLATFVNNFVAKNDWKLSNTVTLAVSTWRPPTLLLLPNFDDSSSALEGFHLSWECIKFKLTKKFASTLMTKD